MFLDSGFLINFGRWPRRIGIYWNNFGWDVNTRFYVSREHLQSKVFEIKCRKFQVFRMSNEIYRTAAKNFFRFAKTVLNVQRIKIRKFLSYKTKLAVLWRFWVNFFTFSGKVRQSCQNCILRSLGFFSGKTLFEALDNVSNFFVL